MSIEPLTADQILENDMRPVWRDADDSWRHGSYVSEVYLRDDDGTYWMATYRLSTDGETNELREGCANINQVWPKEIVTVAYTVEPPKVEGDG